MAAGYHPAASLLVLEDQPTQILCVVEKAVADEMHDVYAAGGLVAQASLQGLERRGRQAFQPHQVALFQPLQGGLQQRPLPFYSQRFHVLRVGQHGQHGQRRGDGQRLRAAWHLQIAHQRRIVRKRQKADQLRRVEVFPWQVGQRGQALVDAQTDAEACPTAVGLVQAAHQTHAHLAAEHRLVELDAEVSDVHGRTGVVSRAEITGRARRLPQK